MKYNLISENGDEKQEIVKLSSIKLKKSGLISLISQL